jgi:hypothetical protein
MIPLSRSLVASLAVLALAPTSPPAQAAADATTEVRLYHAPVTVARQAPYIELALPGDIWRRSTWPALQDLRLLDADGARVPFALLPPAPAAQPAEQHRAVRHYPLPPLPAGDTGGNGALDIRIDGDHLRILRPATTPAPNGASGGWLIDLGPRTADAPVTLALALRWPDADEVHAVADLSHSDDLRQWTPAGSGPLMGLRNAAGETLRQGRLPLPPGVGRYIKLVWSDALQAPRLTGIDAVSTGAPAPAEPLIHQQFAAQPPATEGGERALTFDLGGKLPLQRIDLDLPAGTWLVPVRWQGRSDTREAWQPIGAQVHYRLERHGEVARSPALIVDQRLRYLRALPDTRAGLPEAAQIRLDVQVPAARLVFVAQGRPPYRLEAGAPAGTTPVASTEGALPLHTLIADLPAERARFGQAVPGAWQEDTAATQREARQQQRREMRPWLLWGVLLAGVAGLGAMVWQLMRGSRATPR